MRFLSVVLALLYFTACSVPHDRPIYCDYAQLDGPETELLFRSYSPKAVLIKVDAAQTRQMIASFPAMMDNYLKTQNGMNIESILLMPLLFKAGQYRLQIVTFADQEGRKLALVNFLGLSHSTKNWRKHYYTINDGGSENCRCIIDLNAKKILLAQCNGHG